MKILVYNEKERKIIEGNVAILLNVAHKSLMYYRISPKDFSAYEGKMKYTGIVEEVSYNEEVNEKIEEGELIFILNKEVFRIKDSLIYNKIGNKHYCVSNEYKSILLQMISILVDKFMQDYKISRISALALKTLIDNMNTLKREDTLILR